jgi:nucleoside-diphosphate-sugar epimerase
MVVRPKEFTMRIAITGATGFLGCYLVRQLADAGRQR